MRIDLKTDEQRAAFAPGSGYEHLVEGSGERLSAQIDLTDEVGAQAYRRFLRVRDREMGLR